MLQHEDKMDKFTATKLLIPDVRNLYENRRLAGKGTHLEYMEGNFTL
jgi:hypothetical protein